MSGFEKITQPNNLSTNNVGSNNNKQYSNNVYSDFGNFGDNNSSNHTNKKTTSLLSSWENQTDDPNAPGPMDISEESGEYDDFENDDDFGDDDNFVVYDNHWGQQQAPKEMVSERKIVKAKRNNGFGNNVNSVKKYVSLNNC